MISKRVLIISASIITLGIIFAISLISDKSKELNEQSKDYKIIYSNIDNNISDLNVNVTVNINVTIDDKLKGINPNILKAARTALYNFEGEMASYNHYNFSVSEYVNFFEVIDLGNKHWEVRFRTKEKESDFFQMDGYSMVNVEQDKSGHFSGYIFHSSPNQSIGQTN